MRKSVSQLEGQVSALNKVNLSALGSTLKSIAAPKFDWNPALKQVDDLTSKMKAGKLSMGEYWSTYKTGVDQMVNQQSRLAKAFTTPIGTKGGMAMTIPTASEIAPTVTAAEQLNQKLAIQSQLLGGLGTKLQDWGKNTQWAGRQLTVGLTMPLAMVAVATGKYALDIDQSLTRLEKVYDGSITGLRASATQNAMDITKSLGTSVQSSIDLMGELAAAGKSGQEMMDLTRQAQAMSVLGNIDQADSMKAVISMQNIYKMSTQDVAKSVDYLNAVDAATPTTLADLVASIPIAGATVKQLGGDLKDTTILLSAFREKGIATEEGANAIKSAMNRVLVPTKQAQDLFTKFTGMDINAITKQTAGKPLETMQALSDAIMGSNVALDDQQRIISKLFGTYQSTRITALLSGLQETSGSVAKVKAISAESDQELAAIRQKHEQAITASASGQFKIAVESFKSQMLGVGDIAMKVGTGIVKALSGIFAMFNDLPDGLKKAVIVFGGIVALAGPVTMLVGLLANLGGGFVKFYGWLKGLGTGFKTMTIDEKAAALATDGFNKQMLTQTETAQILVLELGKVRAAIQGVSAEEAIAAAMPASTNKYAGVKDLTGGQVVQHPVTGELYSNTGRALTDTEKQYAQQQLINREKNTTLVTEGKIEAATDKSSKVQKVFSQNSMLAVSAVSGILSMTQDTGSSLGTWMGYISVASLGFTALQPVISSLATKMKGLSLVEAIAGSGGASKVTSAVSAVGSSLKNGLTSALSFMKSPIGLALGAGVLATLGLVKLVSAETEKQEQKHQEILKSTDMWTDALGRTKLVWGQIKNDAGQVVDTIDSMAEKLKTSAGPMVDRFKAVSDPTELNWMTEVEAGNLLGQGLNKKEVTDQLTALLTAAGKTRDEISKVLSDINVKFDFMNGEKDMDVFAADMRKKVNALNSNLLSDKGVEYQDDGTANISADSLINLNQQTDEIKQNFLDRTAGLNPTEKAVFSKKFTDDMAGTYIQAFQDLNDQYGDKLGKDWADARAKFLTPNAQTGDLELNQAGKDQLPADAGVKIQNLAQEEQKLTQSIAAQRGVSADQVKHMQIMSDLLPYLTQNIGDASAVQADYNGAVKAAADAGNTMTDAEKLKLAQVYAAASGLDAATLAAGKYTKASNQTAEDAQANANGIKVFVAALQDAATASDDFWASTANATTGFDALGGAAADQAKTLTDKVKGIYSGAMDNVYSAYSGSADQQWQARLDAITNGFQASKDAVQKNMDALDKSQQAASQKFEDDWNARLDATKQGYEDQISAIDDQRNAIKDEQQAEQDQETQRQKNFDAEKQRIQRMAQLASNNIDYNKALYGGNLDEAARVQVNSASMTQGWAVDDAAAAAKDASDAKLKGLDAQDKTLAAKQDSLKKEEDAVNKTLQAEEEAQKRALQASQDMEKQRLQDKLDSLGKEQTAAENTEKAKQAIQKQSLDTQLATLKAFIPQNEAQLNQHIADVGAAYGQFGLNLQGAGSMWGQIVGNALSNNVAIARQQMSSDANWAAFGTSVANSISQGAFGLNLNDFMNLLVTGSPPPGWNAPQVSIPSPVALRPNGSTGMIARHAGGPIDDSPGTRNGLTGALKAGELPIVAQRGEFMIQKSAVQKLGTQNLNLINDGVIPRSSTDAMGVAGVAGMMGGIMGGLMSNIAVTRLADHYASQNAAVAAALGYTTGGTGAAVDFAKAQDGKPYVWTGVGPNGYDCSGYMSAIANVLTGADNPYKRVFSTGMVSDGVPFGPFLPGLGGVFQIGVKHGNPGHTAGTLMGTNVESTGNHVRYGKDAHGALDKQFPMHFYIPDDKIAAGAAIPGVGGNEPGSDAIQQIVKLVAQRYGWAGGLEWNSLYDLIQQESSWNPNIKNPNSTAYGLFQFLDSTWAGYGIKTSDPRLQTEAGLKYIQSRYRDPIGAWNFHKAHNWYDTGGDLYPGMTMAYNGTKKVETVMTHETTAKVVAALNNATQAYGNFGNLTSSYNVSPANGGINQLPTVSNDQVNIVINATDRTDREIKSMMTEVINDQKRLELKKNGKIK